MLLAMGWLEVLLLDSLETLSPTFLGGVQRVGCSASQGSAAREVPARGCLSQYNQHV